MIDFERVVRLAPSLSVAVLDEETLLLLGDDAHRVLRGRPVSAVAKAIDGQRRVREVLQLAAQRVGDVPALSALHELTSQGLVVDADPRLSPSAAAFFHACGLPEAPAASRVVRLCVAGMDAELSGSMLRELGESLRDAGLSVVQGTSGEPSEALELWLTDDYLRSDLEMANRRHLAAGTAWCLVNPLRSVPWLGPVMAPGGPCWQCMAHYLRLNQPVQEGIRRAHRSSEPFPRPHAYVDASRRVILQMAALSIIQLSAAEPTCHPLYGRLLRFDCQRLTAARSQVLKRPQCSACGEPDLMRSQAMTVPVLTPVPKCLPHRGGYRQHAAADSLARYEALVDPDVGPVRFLHAMDGRCTPLRPVYVSGYAVPPDGPLERAASSLRVCAGKGRSVEQARASALCEAIERESGHYQGDEARLRASLVELGERAVDPRQLLDFSDAQYAAAGLSANGNVVRPALPLPSDVAIDWTPAYGLTAEGQRYVPLSYCYAGTPAEAGAAYCPTNGNGVASGTCLEEALLQALLELVERDAVAIWWYNQLPRPAFDVARLEDAYLNALLAEHVREGSGLWVLDLTHDVGIPVAAAVSRTERQGRQVYSMGFGCHLDVRLAIERAMTERNQLGDGLLGSTDRRIFDTDALPDRTFLHPVGRERDPCALPCYDGPDLQADVAYGLARLKTVGLEVLMVDKTRPDLGLHVAQVIAPGLRHFWPRFGPGRLYDVPVKLGWLNRPRAESELNPVPLLV